MYLASTGMQLIDGNIAGSIAHAGHCKLECYVTQKKRRQREIAAKDLKVAPLRCKRKCHFLKIMVKEDNRSCHQGRWYESKTKGKKREKFYVQA